MTVPPFLKVGTGCDWSRGRGVAEPGPPVDGVKLSEGNPASLTIQCHSRLRSAVFDRS